MRKLPDPGDNTGIHLPPPPPSRSSLLTIYSIFSVPEKLFVRVEFENPPMMHTHSTLFPVLLC